MTGRTNNQMAARRAPTQTSRVRVVDILRRGHPTHFPPAVAHEPAHAGRKLLLPGANPRGVGRRRRRPQAQAETLRRAQPHRPAHPALANAAGEAVEMRASMRSMHADAYGVAECSIRVKVAKDGKEKRAFSRTPEGMPGTHPARRARRVHPAGHERVARVLPEGNGGRRTGRGRRHRWHAELPQGLPRRVARFPRTLRIGRRGKAVLRCRRRGRSEMAGVPAAGQRR